MRTFFPPFVFCFYIRMPSLTVIGSQGIPAAGKWQAAEWTIPLLVEKYPTMSLKMSSKTSEVVKMTMADFGRCERRGRAEGGREGRGGCNHVIYGRSRM